MHSEYLVSYGLNGDFGRFRSTVPLALQRGDRVVIVTHRGEEIGTVLRPAAPGHAQFLPNTTIGKLRRLLTLADETSECALLADSAKVLTRGKSIVEVLHLPVELLDVEMLFDRAHVVLHHLAEPGWDPRALVSALAREFDVHVMLTNLAVEHATEADQEPSHAACGTCGSEAGGCGSCGTGGGCGSCATNSTPAVEPHDAAYFAGLRENIERISLI